MNNGVFEFITNFVAQTKGLHAMDYCHIETSPGKQFDHLSMTDGGFISAINLEGLNKLVGEEESKDAHGAMINIFDFLLTNGHEIDWGFTQNGLEAQQELDEFFRPLGNTADTIGLDCKRDLERSKNVLKGYIRPERNIFYIITKPKPDKLEKKDLAKIKATSTEYVNLFTDHQPAQGFLSIAAFNERLKNEHEAAVDTCLSILESAGYTANRIERSEIPRNIKSDCEYENQRSWNAWLWGDDTRPKITPEDGTGSHLSSLINWGGPALGMQMHPNEIKPDSTGILKVGDYYVAPLLLEMLPEKNNWVSQLLKDIPNNIPFRYRAYIKQHKNFGHNISDVLSRVSNFSKKYLKRNYDIAQSFDYINDLANEKIATACISITMCTWSKSKAELQSNLAIIKAKVSAWGKAQVLVERGDPEEAVIATIPGYSTTRFAPATLESIAEIVKLVPHSRPAAPFEDGFSPLRMECGKLFPMSPISKELSAFIEIIIAGAGSGKSVYQNSINRDSNLKPGNTQIARHATLDIGPSGLGTVKGLRAALPPNRQHEAVYEKLTTSERHACNPFDLQLGAVRPTPVDQGFLQDFIELLVTPKNYSTPSRLMGELVTEVIDAAYEDAFNKETAKIYNEDVSPEIDELLDLYKTDQPDWGLRKTWVKVRDFLFDKGHIKEAIIAQRYAVPLLTDLPSAIKKNASILQRFSKSGEGGGMSLVEEFQTLISAAAKNFPLLTKPTKVDFDASNYIVFDLNDVTQQQGSQQTNVMYALASQLAVKDYWLNDDDLPFFSDKYKKYAEEKIRTIREMNLGITFEEFRRTGGSPKIRSMINRWMAEGRKWGVRVQLVMQQAGHADKEMFGHATVITLMGTWNKTMLDELKERIVITESEERALLNGTVHGPRTGGSSMIIKYNLKKGGWGSQLVYLTKSASELWSTSTTNDDTTLRGYVEELVGDNDIANDVLCTAFKKGSAVEHILRKKKEATLSSDSENIYLSLAKQAIRSWQIQRGQEF